jgi:salicylate hydroxylase
VPPFRRWRDGSRVAAHPVRAGSWYHTRFRAPFYGIHRAHLQTILGAALGDGTVHLGCRLVDLAERPDGIVLEFADGRVEHADLVVGADGVRSTVRRFVTGAAGEIGSDGIYSGTSAFRGLVPVDRIPALPDPHAIQFWMGPDAHVVHYPIGGSGDVVNFLAVVEGPQSWNRSDGWVDEVHEDAPVRAFEGWHPGIIEMIGAVRHRVRWGLFAVRPLLRWYRGRAVLLGDAAHAMLPHQGQGANTTVEDAFALAALLADATAADLPAVLASYQALRRARTRQIQLSSWATSALLHLPDGPAATERDRKTARVPQDVGWIHEYDVQEVLRRRPGRRLPPEPAP